MAARSFIDEVTPLLITYNEIENIARTLDKLGWAGRIVVVDSGSTDGTLDVLAKDPRWTFTIGRSTALPTSAISACRW